MAGWLTGDNSCPLNPSQMTRLQKLSWGEGLRSMRSRVSHHSPSLTPFPIITAHHARSWSVLLLRSRTVPGSQMHRKIHSHGPICFKLRQINGNWREPFKESMSDITGGGEPYSSLGSCLGRDGGHTMPFILALPMSCLSQNILALKEKFSEEDLKVGSCNPGQGQCTHQALSLGPKEMF